MPRAADRSRRALAAAACAFLACATARADIKIEVEGVSEEVRENVLIFLSLSRYRERDDLDADTVQRLHDRVDREVRQALRPFGFYEPKVTAELTPRNDGRDWDVHVQVDPGAPIVVREVSVNIKGPGGEEPMFRTILDQSRLKQGARLEHPAYEKLKGDLQRTAVSSGFLDMKFTRHELLVDPASLTASAYIELETGPRYRFGETTIQQDFIEPQLARRLLRYREGDYFDTLALLKTQFALDDSQYFTGVEITPGTRDTSTLTVPVLITAQSTRRDRYSIGAGYGTDTRWRGSVTWDVRRVNRKGHRARVEVLGANTQRSLEATYIIPVGDPALEKLAFDASWSEEELADLEVEKEEFRPGLTQILGRWQRVLFVTASHEVSVSEAERQEDTLLIPGISFAILPATFSGVLVDLGRGTFAELTGSHSAFGSDANYLRLRLRDERIFDLSEDWHLLLRAELGTSFVGELSELPGSQRFFAGGDQSVRGFGLNELSPVDENGEKTGGRHMLAGSIEIVRDLPRNFGVAVFMDGGNAVNKLGDPIEYSVGIGIRWRIPVVTVGIDVAQAISRSDLGPRLHLNISPRL
jgi:translocation and assembly module TamA